jgi:hypothetical protein
MSAFDRIPRELRAQPGPGWVVWRWGEVDPKTGKRKKPPFCPNDPSRHASSTNPATWGTFEQALSLVEAGVADGIGFALAPPYVGVDLDDELPENERYAIMLALGSYSEVSASGAGHHVILKASLNGGRHPQGIGVFQTGRFWYCTGEHVTGTPTSIEERQGELDGVLAEYLPKPVRSSDTFAPSQPVDLDDRELLERMFSSRSGEKIRRLWEGDSSGYPSPSEADLALCTHLAFWTNRDAGRIDVLFRSSGLVRDKWTEREDYRERTIQIAIEATPEGFQSSRPVRVPTGTRTASRPSEEGDETAIASPRPDVVGTRDGTRLFSDVSVDVELHFVDAASFADENEPGAAALVGDEDNVLVSEGGDVMFYGDGGAGKTTLMIDLALHLAAGDDWLGISVSRPIRVAIVENEGPRPLFRAKLRRKLRAWNGSTIADRLLLLEEPWSKVSLDDRSVRIALSAKIAALELDALLVGPVTRSGMNEAGTLQQVRDYANLIGEVRTASGRRVTFLLAHHENRGGQVSGAWEGAVDTLFHVQAQGNGWTRLHVQKARWSPRHHKQTLKLAWADGEGFEVTEDDERDDNAVADEVLAFVREHPGTGWNKVDDAVPGKGGRLRTIRDNLLAGGRLVNRGSEARMKLWHADDPAIAPGDNEPV